jgi:chromosome segregation ATPase
MFEFLFASSRIKRLERRLDYLEKQNEVLTMALRSIQDNLISAAANSKSLERDVREIRALLNEFVRQAEEAHNAYLLSTLPDDGYEH